MKRSGFQREIEPPVPQRESRLSFANPLSDSRRASTEMRLPRFCRCEDIPTLRCHNVPCPYHPPVGHARTSVPAPLILLPVPQKPRWTHFVLSPSFRPFHWARLRGNSCARQLRIFCFSVSSQKLFANDIEDFLCPSRNADPRFGSRPLSLSSAPITGAEMETQEMYVYVRWNRFSS
jgi:hypothetical protein